MPPLPQEVSALWDAALDYRVGIKGNALLGTLPYVLFALTYGEFKDLIGP